MKKRLAMLFALCLMTGVLSSCGKDTSSTETTKKDDNTLVILNYGKYIDESVLDQFEKETGIKVIIDGACRKLGIHFLRTFVFL